MQDIIPKIKKSAVKKPRKIGIPKKIIADGEKSVQEPAQFSWQTQEYDYHPKNADWFWFIAIITVAVFILSAFFFRNFLFMVLIALSGFTVMLYGARKPKTILFSITSRGIIAGKRLYLYNNVKSFWIHYDPPRKKELFLKSKGTFIPNVIIPLGETDPNAAREKLVKFIKEEPQEESLIDTFSDYFRF